MLPINEKRGWEGDFILKFEREFRLLQESPSVSKVFKCFSINRRFSVYNSNLVSIMWLKFMHDQQEKENDGEWHCYNLTYRN